MKVINKRTGEIIYNSQEDLTLKEAVYKALTEGVDLMEAIDLRGVNLSGAVLRGVNLEGEE